MLVYPNYTHLTIAHLSAIIIILSRLPTKSCLLVIILMGGGRSSITTACIVRLLVTANGTSGRSAGLVGREALLLLLRSGSSVSISRWTSSGRCRCRCSSISVSTTTAITTGVVCLLLGLLVLLGRSAASLGLGGITFIHRLYNNIQEVRNR